MSAKRVEILFDGVLPSGESFPEYELNGINPHGNRCVINSGGCFIKDGICYVDLTYTATTNTTGANNTATKYYPMPKYDGTTLCIFDLTSNAFHYSGLLQIYENDTYLHGTVTSGHKYRVTGSYPTDEADTD